ncbi:12080_t:CDS:2 [Racocetra persica]|uniref:12080_t:CDS:1 n=1 Tax=Racocetra persica TaxID=160502 RepID=A0ACA9NKQ7_9GLOM|nr:12080_t:CDS:2 [Racocetra persica]
MNIETVNTTPLENANGSNNIIHLNNNYTVNERDVARMVYTGLYSRKTATQRHVVETYFDANAVFENPILTAESHNEIINLFLLVSTFFFAITTEIHSITDSIVAGNHHIVCIDSIIKYRLPLRFPPIPCLLKLFLRGNNNLFYICNNEISLRCISKFEFNEQHKIVRHEDIWSIKDLVESLPIVGWLYADVGRKTTGLVTNGLVNLIQELARAWNNLEI